MPPPTRKQLLDHNIRTLPVVDPEGKLVGAVGLRGLTRTTDTVKGVTSKAGTASPDTPAMSLVPVLTDGRSLHGKRPRPVRRLVDASLWSMSVLVTRANASGGTFGPGCGMESMSCRVSATQQLRVAFR